MSSDTMPKTIAVTKDEFGEWLSFDKLRPSSVHSILFDNGCVWDVKNGWREMRLCPHCKGAGKL
jgi:hypothetical protein